MRVAAAVVMLMVESGSRALGMHADAVRIMGRGCLTVHVTMTRAGSGRRLAFDVGISVRHRSRGQQR